MTDKQERIDYPLITVQVALGPDSIKAVDFSTPAQDFRSLDTSRFWERYLRCAVEALLDAAQGELRKAG